MVNFNEEDLTISPTINSIIKLCGEDSMQQLSYDLGGSKIYIPYKIGEYHPLAESLGFLEAQNLSKIYGGKYFTVPITMGRKLRISNLRSEGLSTSKIARKLHCSHSYVKNVISQQENSKQMNLF